MKQISSCESGNVLSKTSKKMSFTELHDIALLAIFDQMDIDQLLTVANLGPRYRDIVIQHYAIPKLRIHEKLIAITLTDYKNRTMLLDKKSLNIFNQKTALQILRTFGSVISRLSFNCHAENSTKMMEIIEYVNDNYSESLNEISFDNCNENHLINLKEPFEMVDTVFFIKGSLRYNGIDHLNRLFPNMRHLELKWVHDIDARSIEQRFPHLERFEFVNPDRPDVNTTKQFLTLNRQLRHFSMWQAFEPDFLYFLNETLPHLETLILPYLKPNFFDENVFDVVHFPNLKSVRIASHNIYRPHHIPFDFNEVEELQFQHYSVNDEWIDVIAQQHGLKRLIIEMAYVNEKQWIKIAEGLSNLTEVKAKWELENSNGLMYLLENCKNLKRMHLPSVEVWESSIVESAIGEEWNIVKSFIDTFKADLTIVRNENVDNY